MCPDVALQRLEAATRRAKNSSSSSFHGAEAIPSAYILDCGLWTACMESREAIERRFKMAEWEIQRASGDLPERLRDLPDAPATASFTSKQETLCCPTYPKSDLFLLRPLKPDTICWETQSLSSTWTKISTSAISPSTTIPDG